MKRVDVEARVSRITWPGPPADLRARILSTTPVAPRAVPLADRIWFSRGWRLAALAMLLVFAGLEQFAGPRPAASPRGSPFAAAEARGVQEAAREAGLPADQASALARRAAFARGRPWADAAVHQLGLDALGIEGGER